MGVGLFTAHVCVLLSCCDGGSVTAPGLVPACKLKRFPSHSEHFLSLSLSLSLSHGENHDHRLYDENTVTTTANRRSTRAKATRRAPTLKRVHSVKKRRPHSDTNSCLLPRGTTWPREPATLSSAVQAVRVVREIDKNKSQSTCMLWECQQTIF